MIIAHFLIGLATVNLMNGYVLLQVRKGDNRSDDDASTRKLPADRIPGAARKLFTNYKPKTEASDELESIVLAIKTNDAKDGKNEGRQHGRRENTVNNIWTDLKQVVTSFMMPGDAQPSFRSKMDKYNIKPEVIKLRSGKPSAMYEIETASVLSSLTDALKSKQARRYTDNIAKTAAYVYRVFNEAY